MDNISAKYATTLLDRNTIIKTMIIGCIVGVLLGIGCVFVMHRSSDISFSSTILIVLVFGWVFAGMPYAWSVLPGEFRLGILAIFLMILKFGVACILGLVLTPIMLIVKTILVNIYKKQVDKDMQLNPQNYAL